MFLPHALALADFVPLSCPAPAALAGESAAVPWLDIVGLVLVLTFLVLGAMRGLWWQIVRLLGVIATFCVARALAPRLGPGVEHLLPALGTRGAHGLIWAAVLLLGMVVVTLIGRAGKASLEGVELGPLDRAGGALFGAASGLCVHVALVLLVCHFASTEFVGKTVRGTQSQNVLDALAHNLPAAFDRVSAQSATPEVYARDSAAH